MTEPVERNPSLRIDIFTLFPAMFTGPFSESIIKRARARGIVEIALHDIRDWAHDKHRMVDDTPYGGGAGMVLRPEPVFATVEREKPPRPLLLLGPGGRRFSQAWARDLAAASDGFSLLCGRYEGVDQRVADHLVDGELSVGDFVLAGGEAAALVVVETVGRLVPGVMGNEASVGEESFDDGLLEYPQYTRPPEFRGWVVPEVLRSGDHGRIARWRHAAALARTLARRPDLIEARGGLSPDDLRLLQEHGYPVSSPGSSPSEPDAP